MYIKRVRSYEQYNNTIILQMHSPLLRTIEGMLIIKYLDYFQNFLFINLQIYLNMSESLSRPLNDTFKQSVQPEDALPKNLPADRASLNEVYTETVVVEEEKKQTIHKGPKKFKILTGLGICLTILGLLMFIAFPPLIQSQIVQQSIDKAILSPDNENFWAHFPGDSKTIITRNYSFFNWTNQEQFFLYGAKPILREVQGYILTQLEDYINIQYIEDGKKVKMVDWLHFDVHPDSRSLQEKLRIVNAPSLGFWYTLKNSRDQLIFIEGFSLLFRSIEDSIQDTVLGQGISSQYLTDFDTAYNEVFKPAGISLDNSMFLWNDAAYGFKDKNNIKYWVEAAGNSFKSEVGTFSQEALDLKDYFTLSDFQLYSILTDINTFSDSLVSIIFENHYCIGIQNCDGRELAVRQLAESYVTYNTPPVATITPTLTICTDNITCNGYYPQLNAFYQEVYLKQHPTADPFLKFDVQMVRKWVDYNPTRKEGQYNKAEYALLHIGNLDALFGNGTLHDKYKKEHFDTTVYLQNIMNRFGLPQQEDTRVFWQWIKYLVSQVLRQGTGNNQKLGIANAYSTAMSQSFSYLQDNLQKTLITQLLIKKLDEEVCDSFISTSLQTTNKNIIQNICNFYDGDLKSKRFVHDSINICRNKYGKEYFNFKNLGASNLHLQSYCEKNIQKSFGSYYYQVRVFLNNFYNCDHTPNQFCSDYELALKQWANSSVTLKQPAQLGDRFPISFNFSSWDPKASPIQFQNYFQKFNDKPTPFIDMAQAYELFNYDHIFSATSNLKFFKDKETSQSWKDYMRYVTVFVGLKGLTNVKTAREYILGYNDEYLLSRKNNYPPFGGDPSTPAYVAFNDLNVTKQEAVLQLEWHTGKGNPLMTAQYYKINGYKYLTTNYTRFNGNETYWVLESPWKQIDYFYGTNGKSFSPDQPNNKNVSIYVPNIQRYGSGSLNQSYPYQRYGYDLSIAYLGRYIYESGDQYPDNKKYYQNFFGVFNQTSVLGIPFFMTKHHFMNCTNWTDAIILYNQDQTIRYTEASHWDDSYVIVQPYSGVSFQSTIFLQANYYYEPDELFTLDKTLLIPVFAIYRSGNLTEEKANQLFKPLTTALNVKVAFFYVGIVLTLIGGGLTAFAIINLKKIKKQEEEGTVKRSIKISLQEQKKKKNSSVVSQKQPRQAHKLNSSQVEDDEGLESKNLVVGNKYSD